MRSDFSKSEENTGQHTPLSQHAKRSLDELSDICTQNRIEEVTCSDQRIDRNRLRNGFRRRAIQVIPSPLEQRLRNDLQGLQWIHKFGWLGATELGYLLWTGNASARHQANRLTRSWLARQLVLARELPERAGRAFVLATAGARLLAEHGVAAASGEDIGETRGESWTPPSTHAYAEFRGSAYEHIPAAPCLALLSCD